MNKRNIKNNASYCSYLINANFMRFRFFSDEINEYVQMNALYSAQKYE